jgi:hypothetical protein
MAVNQVDAALALPAQEIGAALLALHEDQWFDRKSGACRTCAMSIIAKGFRFAKSFRSWQRKTLRPAKSLHDIAGCPFPAFPTVW